MIRIDMTEEPEDENDLIFKAENVNVRGYIYYGIRYKYYDDTFLMKPTVTDELIYLPIRIN